MVIRTLKRIAITAAVLYAAVLLVLMANETSLVYPGSKYPRGNWQPVNFGYDEVEFQSADGTRLVGWYLHPPSLPEESEEVLNQTSASSTETILLCHGNAENVAQSAAYIGDMLRQTLNAEVFVFDYRGFGKSEGVPTEKEVLEDSEAAFEWLQVKSGKPASEIIVAGHSIGGAPATHLASTVGAKTLVLQRTFNAITEPAAKKFPWLPIRYVMRNQLRSVDWIKNFHGPVFQSHGTADTLIPIDMGRDLFNAAPTNKKEFITVDGMSHLDPLPVDYWEKLRDFVHGTIGNDVAKP